MKRFIILVTIFFSTIVLQAQGDFHLFDINNKDGKITPTIIEKAFTNNGFILSVNSEMNLPYTKQFNHTNFKIFNLMTVHHKKLSAQLVAKHPNYGVFMPLAIGIYQGLNEDVLHVSVLTSEAVTKILSFEDPLLKDLETQIVKSIKTAIPNATHSYSEDSIKADDELLVKVDTKLDDDDDDWKGAQEVIEEFVEGGLQPNGFVMPSYLNVNEELSDNGIKSPYDFYVTYSICKLEVIYTVSKTNPEASAFAPCTVMIYKKTGDKMVHLGFPSVYNWMSSAKIMDEKAREVLLKAQKAFIGILKEAVE